MKSKHAIGAKNTVSAALFNARWTGLLSWPMPWKSQYERLIPSAV
jgi:hypothetical protein